MIGRRCRNRKGIFHSKAAEQREKLDEIEERLIHIEERLVSIENRLTIMDEDKMSSLLENQGQGTDIVVKLQK